MLVGFLQGRAAQRACGCVGEKAAASAGCCPRSAVTVGQPLLPLLLLLPASLRFGKAQKTSLTRQIESGTTAAVQRKSTISLLLVGVTLRSLKLETCSCPVSSPQFRRSGPTHYHCFQGSLRFGIVTGNNAQTPLQLTSIQQLK